MTPEELKQQALQNDIDALSNKVTAVGNSLEILNRKLESDSKNQQSTTKSKLEGWGSVITIFVGILSGIAILITQLKQPDNVKADTEAKLADARQKNAEANKLESEIQTSLDSLKRKNFKDVGAYNEFLQDKLPKLQDVLTRLESARVQNQNQNLLYKYIIIWVIFIGLGWFFRILHTIWSNLINQISFSLSNRAYKIKDEKKRNRFRNLPHYMSFLYSLPSVIEIIIDINIFFILIVPIFNETSASLGSEKKFNSVSSEFIRFHIKSAIDSTNSILFMDTTKAKK